MNQINALIEALILNQNKSNKKKLRTIAPIAHNGADKRRFFELVIERRKKCVEHGGAYNPFQTARRQRRPRTARA